jgi:uncharacterized membrane protein
MKRIESVDAVRGFSVLWMIFFQIMDFFSKDHVMSVNFTGPSAFWLATLDYVNWLPPFLFVSGTSAWLMMKKRLSNSSKREVWLHGAKRYGFYLLLSFLLCIWCFNLDTFLYLNEIIGAIAIYGLIALTISLSFYGREREISLLLGGILCFAGLFLAGTFEAVLKYNIYRFYWTLPFFFFGLYSAAMIASKSTKKLAFAGTAFLSLGMLTSLLLEQKISYSERTFGFLLINVGIVLFLFSWLSKTKTSKVLRFFAFIGRYALFFYLFHFAVFYRLARTLDVFQTVSLMPAILITVTSILFMIGIIEAHRRLDILVRIKSYVRRESKNLRKSYNDHQDSKRS